MKAGWRGLVPTTLTRAGAVVGPRASDAAAAADGGAGCGPAYVAAAGTATAELRLPHRGQCRGVGAVHVGRPVVLAGRALAIRTATDEIVDPAWPPWRAGMRLESVHVPRRFSSGRVGLSQAGHRRVVLS